MTHQQALFHDSIYDALTADVAALGGVKKVAAMLWPNHADAASKLRSCLSMGHAQKLDPEEVMAIKRLATAIHSSATVMFEAQQLGFKVEFIAPEDEAASLRRELRDLLKVTNQRMARLEKVEGGL